MAIHDKIRDEKLQYGINRQAGKISALLSGKIDQYQYLTGEEMLPNNQIQMIEHAKFRIYAKFTLRERFRKTNKETG